jgi:hypothetical protein
VKAAKLASQSVALTADWKDSSKAAKLVAWLAGEKADSLVQKRAAQQAARWADAMAARLVVRLVVSLVA